MEIQEYVDVKNYSTFKIGGQFRYFTIISSISDLPSFYAIAHNDGRFKNIPIFILGGGSNVVFSGGIINVLALKIEIKGFEIVSEGQDYVDIRVGAGEIWDEIVSRTVEMGLSGFESLSAIPGTIGAGPVQNIGAYGAEVKDTILEVEVFDIEKGIIKTISNADCKFGYRDSIFKNEAKGKYIITAVFYRLTKWSWKNSDTKQMLFHDSHSVLNSLIKNDVAHVEKSTVSHQNFSKVLTYPGVMKYFEDTKTENPTLKQIREAIINIRSEKLPNPKDVPNVGSFFKNPIISKESFLAINPTYGKIPYFDVEKDKTTRQDLVKIPAGWLIENAGLKGKSFGSISIYDKNALVLINNGNASKDDLLKAKNEIIKIVEDKFGIILEQEPEVI